MKHLSFCNKKDFWPKHLLEKRASIWQIAVRPLRLSKIYGMPMLFKLHTKCFRQFGRTTSEIVKSKPNQHRFILLG